MGYGHVKMTSSSRVYYSTLGQSNYRGPILFYNRDEPYYEFTNFAPYSVTIDGIKYPTSEHYFQSQKLVGTPYCKYIATLERPRQAFEFPRKPHVAGWVRKDWQSVKNDVMYKALYHKFKQHQRLYQLLLGTQDRRLVEHSPYDSYWGDGGDGKGLNKLGELLMKLRNALRGHPSSDSTVPAGYQSFSCSDSTSKAEKQRNKKSTSARKKIQLDDSSNENDCVSDHLPEVQDESKLENKIESGTLVDLVDPKCISPVVPPPPPPPPSLSPPSNTFNNEKPDETENVLQANQGSESVPHTSSIQEDITELKPHSESNQQYNGAVTSTDDDKNCLGEELMDTNEINNDNSDSDMSTI